MLQTGLVDGVVDAINQLKPMLLEGFDAKMLNDQISIKPVSIISKKGHHLEELDTFASFIHGEAVQKQLREQIALYQFELRRSAARCDQVTACRFKRANSNQNGIHLSLCGVQP